MNTQYDLAIESFIEYLDGMEIAEEGDVFVPPLMDLIPEINEHSQTIFAIYCKSKMQDSKEFCKVNRIAPRVSKSDVNFSKKCVTFLFELKGPEPVAKGFLSSLAYELNKKMTNKKEHPYKSWTTDGYQLIAHW